MSHFYVDDTKVVRHTIDPSRPGKKWPTTNGWPLILTGGEPGQDESNDSFEYDYSSDSDESEDLYYYDNFENKLYSSPPPKHAGLNRSVTSEYLSIVQEHSKLKHPNSKFTKHKNSGSSVQSSAQSNIKSAPIRREKGQEPKLAREKAASLAKTAERMEAKGYRSSYITAGEDR
jgi:hypothetical protein